MFVYVGAILKILFSHPTMMQIIIQSVKTQTDWTVTKLIHTAHTAIQCIKVQKLLYLAS